MGKKSGSQGAGEKVKQDKAKAFVLKVDMHCNCRGCIDKIRAAVKGITTLKGIEGWDQSAVESKGELRLVATADPEKLQQRLHKATRKHVDLLFPKDKKQDKQEKQAAAGSKDDAAAAAAAQALLNSLQAQGQYAQLLAGANAGGWNAHGGGGYQSAGYATAYPSWTLQQQQQQPDPYAAAYSAAYPGAGWGAYSAYPQSAPHGHGYGWHGHGY